MPSSPPGGRARAGGVTPAATMVVTAATPGRTYVSETNVGGPATDWTEVAREVADGLVADALTRDRDAKPPTAEVEALRRAELLALMVPADLGGGGQSWPVVHRVIRVIGAADASIGQLLAAHYVQLWRLGLFAPPATSERLEMATARHRWFWAGAGEPLAAPVTLTPAGDGFLADGRTWSALGPSVADRLVVDAVRTDTGAEVTFTIGWRAPGIRFHDDEPRTGLRLVAGGGVEFAHVPVAPGEVVGERPLWGSPEEPRWSLEPLASQLARAQLAVATAEGALAAAAACVREVGELAPAPAPASPAAALPAGEAPVERDGPASEHAASPPLPDPALLATHGELVAQVAAAGTLLDQAVEVLAAADSRGLGLTADERGGASVAVARAALVADRTAVEVTGRAAEVAGPRATAARHGFDRYWRDARSLTLRSEATAAARIVGAHSLTGLVPTHA